MNLDKLGFQLEDIQKSQKLSQQFFLFLSCHYGFTKFSILKKYKPQKIVKSSFLAFLADFFLSFAFKPYGTLKMLILGAQDNFHIELLCRRTKL